MLNEQEVIAYLENTLSPAGRGRVEAALERDPKLRREVVRQAQMEHALRAALGEATANERVKQSVLAVLRGGSEAALKRAVLRDTRPRVRAGGAKPALRWIGLLAGIRAAMSGGFEFAGNHRWAAVILLLLGLGLPVWVLLPGAVRDVEVPVLVQFQSGTVRALAGQGIRAGQTASATVRFADGTILHLEPGTEISLQPVANPSRRGGKQIRLLAGGLSARVARQPEGLPLLIQTPHALVTVVGTEFDLNVAANQTALEVTHGMVKLAGDGEAKAVNVAAGEFAVAAPRAPMRHGRLARNPYRWPFSSASVWNRPLGNDAKFAPVPCREFVAEGRLQNAVRPRRPFLGGPADPLRRIWVNGEARADVRLAEANLPRAGMMDALVLLQQGRRHALELRGATVRPDGDLEAQAIARTDLAGPGADDSAGGAKPFGLSHLGGLLRAGELENGIRHALAARVSRERLGGRNSFATPGTVWPATGGDAAGTEFLNVGSLLAIPPDVDIVTKFGTNGPAFELARAMQDFGVYVTGFIDAPFVLLADTGGDPRADEWLNQIVPLLKLVTNNARVNAGVLRRELAPELSPR
jgi:anti-sigma factor RsiW